MQFWNSILKFYIALRKHLDNNRDISDEWRREETQG